MKTVKFLKAKSYGGTLYRIGSVIPMRADHANLLQQLGIVVIEDSPIVKIPIPGIPTKAKSPTEQPPTPASDPKQKVPEQSELQTDPSPESEKEKIEGIELGKEEQSDRTDQDKTEKVQSTGQESEKLASKSRRQPKSEK